MADYFWGEIEIGGPVPPRLVNELLDPIGRLDRDDPINETPFYATDEASLLEQLDESTHVLHLVDGQARYGQFEELEAFLREHGMAYDRRSAGKYEFSPELVQFRPGMPNPESCLLTNEDVPVVKLDNVREAYELLKCGRSSAALANLRQVIGPDVSALAPLTIV